MSESPELAESPEPDETSAAPDELAPEGWLPQPAAALFGEGATALDAYDLLTVDVPADRWITALQQARDELNCTYFDWLSAVDEPGTGFFICAHLVVLPSGGNGPRRLLLRTTVPHEAPELPTATEVYAGAAWHERETHEMFGVNFAGHPHLDPLLLPDGFEGHPLRKDFVLAARVAKAWPGAKEPGEGHEGTGSKRRQMLPPGVPDPNEWGPLKGQLPPAPARPAKGRAAGAADRPRRTRSAAAGSASQTEAPETPARPARRARTVGEGSASQRATSPEAVAPPEAGPTPESSAEDGGAPIEAARPRRSRSASDGSSSQPKPTPEEPPSQDGSDETPSQEASSETRGSGDAPWHNPRPAFDEPDPSPSGSSPSSPPENPDVSTNAETDASTIPDEQSGAGAEGRRTEDDD